MDVSIGSGSDPSVILGAASSVNNYNVSNQQQQSKHTFSCWCRHTCTHSLHNTWALAMILSMNQTSFYPTTASFETLNDQRIGTLELGVQRAFMHPTFWQGVQSTCIFLHSQQEHNLHEIIGRLASAWIIDCILKNYSITHLYTRGISVFKKTCFSFTYVMYT